MNREAFKPVLGSPRRLRVSQVGYKNMMSVRRTSWRTVDSYREKEEKDPSDPAYIANIKAYQNTIAEEIDAVIEKAAPRPERQPSSPRSRCTHRAHGRPGDRRRRQGLHRGAAQGRRAGEPGVLPQDVSPPPDLP